ncbi:hypothetical protein AHAS_Ahas03G0251100 [Arachis hypogaea]|uniref:Uncharacterized protein n=1 Tax=Arachis hypogaea TaxID=3818 RepID=A0A445DTY7_ARAHY|nr:hypothetical protein Ahy_A03g012594 [Arachis hypogaea]
MRKFSFDIICKFSFEIDTECFIPSFSESKLADSFDLASKAISTTNNVAVAARIETEAITEHWFREEVEGSDQCGGQRGHGDDRVEEEGDGNDDNVT